MKKNDPSEFSACITKLFHDEFKRSFPHLKKSARNRTLRAQIIKYLAAQILTDDERASYFGLPEGCRIRESAKIISPEKLKCGKYVWIGEGAILDASGNLTIGNHTSIGNYVLIWTHSSAESNLNMSNQSSNTFNHRKPTKIGNGCLIAGHSVVYSGVTIGDRTIIVPMSVVTKDIPGNCIAGGSPAKIIKKLK